MKVSKAIEKMIIFYDGSLHDINHFLKVWSYARTIGTLEKLDTETQLTLELAAVVHDIACPLCREKYGNTAGVHQQTEGIPLPCEFYAEFDIAPKMLDRICYLVGHHHTFENVDGLDYQVLLEADFLVNADESNLSHDAIVKFRDKVFKTPTGIRLLNDIYNLNT